MIFTYLLISKTQQHAEDVVFCRKSDNKRHLGNRQPTCANGVRERARLVEAAIKQGRKISDENRDLRDRTPRGDPFPECRRHWVQEPWNGGYMLRIFHATLGILVVLETCCVRRVEGV